MSIDTVNECSECVHEHGWSLSFEGSNETGKVMSQLWSKGKYTMTIMYMNWRGRGKDVVIRDRTNDSVLMSFPVATIEESMTKFKERYEL